MDRPCPVCEVAHPRYARHDPAPVDLYGEPLIGPVRPPSEPVRDPAGWPEWLKPIDVAQRLAEEWSGE